MHERAKREPHSRASWLFGVGLAVLLSLSPLVAPEARAGGYGAALEYEWTDSDISEPIPFNPGRTQRDFEQHMGGFQFVYDTNVARDEVLNYRVRVGFRVGERKYDDKQDVRVPRRTDDEDPDEETISFEQDEESLWGFTFHQTVGYGFLRDERYRVWAGPSVRLNVDWHSPTTNLDVINVAFGAGPELGINYHLSDRISLGLTATYNIMYLSEVLQVNGPDRDFDGYQHMGAIAIHFFWRSEDDAFGVETDFAE